MSPTHACGGVRIGSQSETGRKFAFKTYVLVATPAATPASGLASCKGQQATHVGTTGNDEITGTPGPDVIVALGGNDKVSGLQGEDLICGGDGKDSLKGGGDEDTLLGQKGADTLKGGGDDDTCKGGKGRGRREVLLAQRYPAP